MWVNKLHEFETRVQMNDWVGYFLQCAKQGETRVKRQEGGGLERNTVCEDNIYSILMLPRLQHYTSPREKYHK